MGAWRRAPVDGMPAKKRIVGLSLSGGLLQQIAAVGFVRPIYLAERVRM